MAKWNDVALVRWQSRFLLALRKELAERKALPANMYRSEGPFLTVLRKLLPMKPKRNRK